MLCAATTTAKNSSFILYYISRYRVKLRARSLGINKHKDIAYEYTLKMLSKTIFSLPSFNAKTQALYIEPHHCGNGVSLVQNGEKKGRSFYKKKTNPNLSLHPSSDGTYTSEGPSDLSITASYGTYTLQVVLR